MEQPNEDGEVHRISTLPVFDCGEVVRLTLVSIFSLSNGWSLSNLTTCSSCLRLLAWDKWERAETTWSRKVFFLRKSRFRPEHRITLSMISGPLSIPQLTFSAGIQELRVKQSNPEIGDWQSTPRSLLTEYITNSLHVNHKSYTNVIITSLRIYNRD